MPLKLCKSTMQLISDYGKISNELSTNSKSITRFSCKSNQIAIVKRERLSGGADVSDIEENVRNVAKSTDAATPIEPTIESTTEIPKESSKQFPTNKSTLIDKQINSLSSPCCICAIHVTSDIKINELIEYAHQNLQDAGKALATLGENFEHGLKVESYVLGKIQHWSTTVQNKLDICKEDIEHLRKELLSQICAINDKENKIRELNKHIVDLTTENDRLKKQIAECTNESTNCEQMLAERRAELERMKKAELELTPLVIEPSKPANPIKEDINIPIENPIIKPREKSIEKPREKSIEKPREKSIEKQIEKPIERSERLEKIEETKEMKRKSLIQTREKDRERKRRETELESEIGRLRKENEKLMKERIDYENAIQRALLRGVSSLNVEALRVLRSPPIPCCSPCSPCPMSFIPTATEDTIPCPGKMRRSCLARTVSKVCNNSYGNGKNMKYDQCDNTTIKQPCASPCCSAGKNLKSSNNSMFFLLHQGDAENVCKSNERSSPRPCGSPIMKRIEIPPCLQFTRP
ncbi:hypothetical protein M0802_007952 [Mischocyttarus mexicanus]|nr:hypothetical protein M0802_007952 [Mischocyttarus mexicanus]